MNDYVETFRQLVEIIVNKTDFDPDLLMGSTRIDDIGLDSLDEVELVIEIEEYFSIEMDAENLEKIETVTDLINKIRGI